MAAAPARPGLVRQKARGPGFFILAGREAQVPPPRSALAAMLGVRARGD